MAVESTQDADMIPYLTSTKYIDKRFYTGEEPVLVECSDMNAYICKYSRYSGSANKLVCELLGALFAKDWMLRNPDIAIVKVLSLHVPSDMSGSMFALPTLGSRLLHHAIDITPTSFRQIPISEKLCMQLLRIALFDFWIANEDRNANNANLMYDVANDNLIAIDFGCSFNTATFDYPLSQLTETDSILSSELFRHLRGTLTRERVMALADILLRIDMPTFLHDVQTTATIINMWENADPMYMTIPREWNIRKDLISAKLEELMSDKWIDAIKMNFMDCLTENVNNE